MAPPAASTLADLLASTTPLLAHFSDVLSTPPSASTSTSTTANVPSVSTADPLKTLGDAASLLKAHATKLGLLLLNAPFTPSAVAKVLAEMTGTCLPAMMSALELATGGGAGPRFGACVDKELRGRVRQVVSAVSELVDDVRQVAGSSSSSGGGGGGGSKQARAAAEVRLKKQNNSTLASTAQTWSACDALLGPAASPAAIVLAQAESYRALLRDAVDELREWAEDEDEGFDGGEVSDEDSDVQFGPPKCPAGDRELRAKVDSAVRRLGMCEVGMRAVGKRRLKGFEFGAAAGTGEEGVERQRKRVEQLDGVIEALKKVPEEADELAGKFYELDGAAAQSQLERCCEAAIEAVEMVRNGWDAAEEDRSFGEWVDKWKALLQKA